KSFLKPGTTGSDYGCRRLLYPREAGACASGLPYSIAFPTSGEEPGTTGSDYGCRRLPKIREAGAYASGLPYSTELPTS
ncbi:MAG: hypothetical protein Q4D98_12575, partial [Planctomycetia bacterium]|nr:hypothetical protein [Planctomycetia bacterium]